MVDVWIHQLLCKHRLGKRGTYLTLAVVMWTLQLLHKHQQRKHQSCRTSASLHAPTNPTNATPGSLKAAAPRIISWHIFNFSEGTTSEDIAQYTETVLKIQRFQCEQLKVTRGNYTSFRLDVPATATSIIKHPSSWPEGVTVRRFQIVTSKNSQHNAGRTTRK
ncbi:hypothetical protein O0L34_g16572 [Tuta absoluta]|nr:hypothetical protein O0L34_g16572 [Tuta absoluta]